MISSDYCGIFFKAFLYQIQDAYPLINEKVNAEAITAESRWKLLHILLEIWLRWLSGVLWKKGIIPACLW